ncbi:hypothetical protein RCL1_007473 [Eukaryota sp. TZLM3-RCL]
MESNHILYLSIIMRFVPLFVLLLVALSSAITYEMSVDNKTFNSIELVSFSPSSGWRYPPPQSIPMLRNDQMEIDDARARVTYKLKYRQTWEEVSVEFGKGVNPPRITNSKFCHVSPLYPCRSGYVCHNLLVDHHF